jgi:hypothetical protein
MNELLTKLGVSAEIQALFNVSDDLHFDYGDSCEHYFDRGHLVPASKNLWRAGNELAAQVIIGSSVMELIAFMKINNRRYSDPGNLCFIATGNNWHPAKCKWIRSSFKKRKFTLVFGNDLTGRLCDIKVAIALRSKSARMTWSEPYVHFTTGNRTFELEQDAVSLAAFERQAGIRTHIRTVKPFPYNTYLEQLTYDGK